MGSRRSDNLQVYQLILGQLRDDGLTRAMAAVSEATLIPPPTIEEVPSNRLSSLVSMTMATDDDGAVEEDMPFSAASTPSSVASRTPIVSDIAGIDFDDPKASTVAKPANFVTRFITTHKNGCRVAKFSHDGHYVATGSSDTSIKLLDVTKMKTFSQQKSDVPVDVGPMRPVIRTFYDHTQSVNDLDFHPFLPILISCARDSTIKFYDYKSSAKRARKFIQDPHIVRTINFHPGGDYIIVGTDHHMIRLYDVNTHQAFTCAEPKDNHCGAINQVRYSLDGSLYVSCSKDGFIRLWDGVMNRCVRFFPQAHGGAEVSSVQFSRNNKYLLSSGKDSVVKLWDLATGKVLKTYVGGVQLKNRLQACFTYNEDYVLGSDEKSNSGIVWDTRTAEIKQRLTGHNNIVRWMAASPVENSIISCSDDHRARFWTS